MVGGVPTGFGTHRVSAAADDAPGPAIVRAWCRDGVLAVPAAFARRKPALAVAEHVAIARVPERPACQDQPVSLLRLGRQRRKCNRIRRPQVAARIGGRRRSRRNRQHCCDQPIFQRIGDRRPPDQRPRVAPEFQARNATGSGCKTQVGCRNFGQRPRALSMRLQPCRANVSGMFPQRRKFCGEDPGQRNALASTTVSAVRLTRRRTVDDGVRM